MTFCEMSKGRNAIESKSPLLKKTFGTDSPRVETTFNEMSKYRNKRIEKSTSGNEIKPKSQ